MGAETSRHHTKVLPLAVYLTVRSHYTTNIRLARSVSWITTDNTYLPWSGVRTETGGWTDVAVCGLEIRTTSRCFVFQWWCWGCPQSLRDTLVIHLTNVDVVSPPDQAQVFNGARSSSSTIATDTINSPLIPEMMGLAHAWGVTDVRVVLGQHTS